MARYLWWLTFKWVVLGHRKWLAGRSPAVKDRYRRGDVPSALLT